MEKESLHSGIENNKMNNIIKTYEQILSGVLYSIDEKQYSAIKKVHEIGERIAKEFKEKIGSMRKSGSTNAKIAKKVIPEIYENYPAVAQTAISYALGIILGEDRQKITMEILSKLGKKKSNIKRLKKIAPLGMNARIKKYGEDEVTNQRKEGGKNSAELQGKVILSEKEKELIVALCNKSENRNKLGQIKRQEIAEKLNKEFWGGEKIRNGTAIADCFRRHKPKE